MLQHSRFNEILKQKLKKKRTEFLQTNPSLKNGQEIFSFRTIIPEWKQNGKKSTMRLKSSGASDAAR